MKILVIGGSYFYGRVFVMLAAKEHDVTVVNRGTYSMEAFGVRQIKGDRHNASLWRQCREAYDAVVDFCAYEPGDIGMVMENLSGSVGQYVLISTVDVYRRQGGDAANAVNAVPVDAVSCRPDILKDEDTPYETRRFSGEAGAYIAGKVALEQELREKCAERDIAYTILRPAILYGPYNYAPRESLFIQMAVKDSVLPWFSDAAGRFQFVYVKDAAVAILKCLGNERACGRAYNLCGDEILDYDLFFRELAHCAEEAEAADSEKEAGEKQVGEKEDGEREAGERETGEKEAGRQEADNDLRKLNEGLRGRSGLRKFEMTLDEARIQGIPTPFPATAEETELVSNTRSKEELEMKYISLREGMAKTYNAFRHVYM